MNLAVSGVSGISNQITVNGDINAGAKSSGASFGEYLKSALDSLNEGQLEADGETTKLITGQPVDIHQVLISAQEAKIQMELAVEVRNKLVDSYQEIMRMQV